MCRAVQTPLQPEDHYESYNIIQPEIFSRIKCKTPWSFLKFCSTQLRTPRSNGIHTHVCKSLEWINLHITKIHKEQEGIKQIVCKGLASNCSVSCGQDLALSKKLHSVKTNTVADIEEGIKGKLFWRIRTTLR